MKFVVTGCNIAIGIFPDMAMATASLIMSCDVGSIFHELGKPPTPEYVELVGKIKGVPYVFTIVAVMERSEASLLF